MAPFARKHCFAASRLAATAARWAEWVPARAITTRTATLTWVRRIYNQATGLYRNDGKGNYDDVTIAAGLAKETRFVVFGIGMVDFDNDGYPDLMVSTGSVYPEVACG